MPDVEDKAEDHKDPSPTAHSAANRAVGKDVEQGRIGKDDQPEERDEEAVECTVHQVRENPDQRESDSWREPGKQCEQTPHPPTFLSGPRCEPLDTTLWTRSRRPDSPTAGERANARQARPPQLACVADQVKKILGTRSARKEFSILLNRGHVQALVTVLPVIRMLEVVSLLVSLVSANQFLGSVLTRTL